MVAVLVVFVLATVGSKLLLGLVFIYYLLPKDHRCAACDGDTVPLVPRPGFRLLSRLCRVQRRLCLRCGRTELAQRDAERRVFIGQTAPPPVGERLSR